MTSSQEAPDFIGFSVRWFAWRSAYPISIVTGYRAAHLLFGTSNEPDMVIPRRMAFWMVRTLGMWSYPEIGRALGRDHTTIRLATVTVEQSLKEKSMPYYPLMMDVLEVDRELRRP